MITLKMITLLFKLFCSLISAMMNRFLLPKPKAINGKVVLITGAAQGIGQQLAYKFASHGVQLALVDLNEKGLLETKECVERIGITCRTYVCDVSNREEVAKLGADVREDFGTVDILVNNAGVVQVKNFLELKDSEIKKTIDVNLFGTIWMTKEFITEMVDRNDGHIVNICSMNGFTVTPRSSPYCASKFGVNGFGQALIFDLKCLKKTGVHLTTAYPGPVDTPMVRTFIDPSVAKPGYLENPKVVAEKIVNGVLTNKIHVYVPECLWILGAMRNLFPVESIKTLDDYQMKLIDSTAILFDFQK